MVLEPTRVTWRSWSSESAGGQVAPKGLRLSVIDGGWPMHRAVARSLGVIVMSWGTCASGEEALSRWDGGGRLQRHTVPVR